MEQKGSLKSVPGSDAALALVGAVIGGGVGFFAFGWLAGQGFYALALPGVLLGVGAAVLGKRRSTSISVTCGTLALVLGVFAEWKHFPFVKDSSLAYFLTHLSDLRPLTLIMIGLGGFAGFWFAKPTRGTPPGTSSANPGP